MLLRFSWSTHTSCPYKWYKRLGQGKNKLRKLLPGWVLEILWYSTWQVVDEVVLTKVAVNMGHSHDNRKTLMSNCRYDSKLPMDWDDIRMRLVKRKTVMSIKCASLMSEGFNPTYSKLPGVGIFIRLSLASRVSKSKSCEDVVQIKC